MLKWAGGKGISNIQQGISNHEVRSKALRQAQGKLVAGLIGFVLAAAEGGCFAINPYGTSRYGHFGVRQIGFVCTSGHLFGS
jgi:hypothetical protein